MEVKVLVLEDQDLTEVVSKLLVTIDNMSGELYAIRKQLDAMASGAPAPEKKSRKKAEKAVGVEPLVTSDDGQEKEAPPWEDSEKVAEPEKQPEKVAEPEKQPEKVAEPEKQPEKIAEPEEKYTEAEIRAFLAGLIKAGKRDQIAGLWKEFGVEKLSAIPPEKYAAVMKKAKEL